MRHPNIDEGLVEDYHHPTDEIPAEFPSIELESDLEDSAAVVGAAPSPDWAIAEQVLANANLTPLTGDGNITGVDLNPAVTDDEEAVDKAAEEEGDDKLFIETPDEPLPKPLEVMESDNGDVDNNDDGDVPFPNDEGRACC
jgi:hypothetical protein